MREQWPKQPGNQGRRWIGGIEEKSEFKKNKNEKKCLEIAGTNTTNKAWKQGLETRLGNKPDRHTITDGLCNLWQSKARQSNGLLPARQLMQRPTINCTNEEDVYWPDQLLFQ